MVGIGPNGNSQFHPESIRQLKAAGEWLRINSEGIYGTRYGPHNGNKECRFDSLQIREGSIIYAFTFE